MLKVEAYEQIRRAYYVEGKSMRQISRELNHSRKTVKKAIERAEPEGYQLKEPREAPVLGPYKQRLRELLAENERLPRKQRWTNHQMYHKIKKEGYQGSESGVNVYLWQQRKGKKRPKVYLPLEFDPGIDGQVDWGEAVVTLGGERVTVQLFVMRLNYSRKIFVMAFPRQRQEAFLAGHVAAFHHFGGVPHRLAYDNLKAAVQRILTGRHRQQQERFVVFRSHYLFESRFCTPGAGNEKGRVEEGVGYARRNFIGPELVADDYDDLNEQLRQACLADDQRRVARQPETIYQAWQTELKHLRPLPASDYDCCLQRSARLNGYSQVVVETNRYSVPVDKAERKIQVKLYPFQIELFGSQQREPIAVHPRCYEREQDILEPLHYLPLLAQRPGALDHAKPIRQWRTTWPTIYEQLLARLQQQWPEGRGVREFIGVLQLHQHHPAALVEKAVRQAWEYNCAHLDGVRLCLNQLLHPAPKVGPLDLSHQPNLTRVGHQPVQLSCYDQLLAGG
jgi:transposase